MMSNHGSDHLQLPQDIIDKISEYLQHDTDKLVSVLCFFCNRDIETSRYIQILRSVSSNDKAFQGIVNNLVEDTKKLKDDPNFLCVMADIWNNYLEPNEKKNVGNGQRFDFQLVLSDLKLIEATAAYNFISALSKLPPSVQNEVVQLTINAANIVVGSKLALTLHGSFNNLLQITKSTSGKIVAVGLVAVYLAFEAWNNLKLWWKGEITGIRCAKNVIDSLAGMTAGAVGGIAGAAVGSSIVTGIGVAIGAAVAPAALAVGSILGGVIGGVASATAASNISDWLTQKIFNLPKEVALENAYRFLDLEYGASNVEINSSFRHLALEYHPDKGGSYDDWHKLQVTMAIIKLSKGEI